MCITTAKYNFILDSIKDLRNSIKELQTANNILKRQIEISTNLQGSYAIALKKEESMRQVRTCLNNNICPDCGNTLVSTIVDIIESDDYSAIKMFRCNRCGFTHEDNVIYKWLGVRRTTNEKNYCKRDWIFLLWKRR
mgnify:CR=1 FL=1